MDFMNRAQQPRPVAPANANNVGAVAQNRKHDHDGSGDGGKWYRTGTVVLLGLIVILVIAMTGFFAWGNMGEQSKYLNKNEYQAVFVNVNGTSGGQVYFGHIQAVNSQYIDLTNVFYIQNQSSGSSSQSSQTSSSYTLVKLGCELHGPEDQMVINTSQVYFWENLKPSGQVSQKIAQYYKQNPNGQTCTQTNSTTQSNATTQSSTNTNASNGSSATTTPSSSTSSSTKKQ